MQIQLALEVIHVSKAVNQFGRKGFRHLHLQAMSPTLPTTKFAVTPRRIPKAVHICQVMTKAPRIAAGLFSAAKIGTVEALMPIPMPSRSLVIKSCGQFCVKAPPMGVIKQKMAEMKIVPDAGQLMCYLVYSWSLYIPRRPK